MPDAQAPALDDTAAADLERRVLAGDVRALARAISLVEDRDARVQPLMERIFRSTGSAQVLGVTGAPGAGKSTVVDCLVDHLRRQEQKVSVIAVDPTSPFTGGALLGDRVRMQRHALDGGVYIRSMAARGHLGGLSAATRDVVRVLDAAGFERVILETVGVGQSELEIMGIADTTVLVLTPAMGDAVQTIKAGIMEIADVFCVNKADLPGLARILDEVRQLVQHSRTRDGWRPLVVETVATEGAGIPELWDAAQKHRAFLASEGILEGRRTERLRDEVSELVADHMRRRAYALMQRDPGLKRQLQAAVRGDSDPYQIARQVIAAEGDAG